MRKQVALLSAALCLLSIGTWPAPLLAATETVTGEVVSLSCYFQNKKNVGKAGLLCAQATVKYEGNPVGIVTSDGKVYQLAGGLVANNNAKVVPLLSHTVTVSGEVSKKAGILVISADEAKDVK
jgi:alanine dehydrogenase